MLSNKQSTATSNKLSNKQSTCPNSPQHVHPHINAITKPAFKTVKRRESSVNWHSRIFFINIGVIVLQVQSNYAHQENGEHPQRELNKLLDSTDYFQLAIDNIWQFITQGIKNTDQKQIREYYHELNFSSWMTYY